jgi:hypothetical protein
MTGCIVAFGVYYLGGNILIGIILEQLGIIISIEMLLLLPYFFIVGIFILAVITLLFFAAIGKEI